MNRYDFGDKKPKESPLTRTLESGQIWQNETVTLVLQSQHSSTIWNAVTGAGFGKAINVQISTETLLANYGRVK